MIIERSGEQKSKTLDAFYAQHAQQGMPEGATAMLDLLAALRAHPDPRRVWGLTSLARLCFLAQDTWKSPWYVIVGALDQRNYYIEYRMPPDIAPWPEAYVRGEAQSQEEAVKMILIAMDASQGWSSSPPNG